MGKLLLSLLKTFRRKIKMELTTKEIVKKMILDSQEMIRDYEVHSKKVNDMEVADLFKKFAEECGYQAAELQKVLKDKF